jgi:hypothetical protein
VRTGAVALALGIALACSGGGDAGGRPPAPPEPPGPPPLAPAAPAAPAAPEAPAGPSFAGCPVFPPDHAWNRDISADPVDPASSALLAALGDGALRIDAGVGEPEFGATVAVVGPEQPPALIEFGTAGEDYRHQSDPGPYPIPPDAPVQGGRPGADPPSGDRHVLVVQRGTCLLYELYQAERIPGGFRVSAAARWDLRTGAPRPPGWTSADGGGLPILPGLVRDDELAAGRIAHALRFTAPRVRQAYVAPANHCGGVADPSLPPFGTRLRLRADFDLAPYSGPTRVLLEALRRHGMILADQGPAYDLSGTSAPIFADVLRQLREKPVPASAFEVVRLGPVQGC